MKQIVLVLGSAYYILEYAKLLKKTQPKSLLLIVDRYQKPKTKLPTGAEYLQLLDNNKYFEEILTFCKRNDYIITAVLNRIDSFEYLHGKLCDALQLSGPTESAIKKLANKASMHSLAVKSNLAFYRPLTISFSLAKAETALNDLQFPIIMKQARGAKSRGVVSLKTKNDFYMYRELFLKEGIYKPTTTVLFEQQIQGKQVTPTAYVDQSGKVHILALVDVLTAREVGQNHMQLVYRSTPSIHTENVRQKIAFVLQRLISKAKLKSVVLHPEFFVVGKNVYLIEINIRIGGFRHEIMKEAYGIDLNKISWDLAFGITNIDDNINHDFSCTACEVWEEKSGVISQIMIPKSKFITQFEQKKFVGDMYIAPPEKQEPIANFYVKSQDDSLKIAQKIRKKLQITI